MEFGNQFIIHSFVTTSLSTALLGLFKSAGTVFSLCICALFTSALKLAKPNFAAKLDVSTPFAFFKSSFAA